MTAIRINQFGGRIPRYSAERIPESNATVCTNAECLTGTLEPFNANTTVNTPTKVGTIQTIYRWAPTAGNAASGYWFHWTEDVDIVRSPVGGNTTDRVIFTGQTEPRITDNTIATTGGTNYPMNWYILGVPAPTAPTAALTAGGTCGTEEQVDTAYVVTYVSAWGEEGPPSPASNMITGRCPGHQVNLTSLATAPAGNYNIATKRIYRAYNGSYYLVAEINVATTTYADTKTDAQLGSELPSLDWVAPPTSMKGIVAMPNGIIVGFDGNEVIPSVPYQPHAYPYDNRQAVDHKIVGLGVFGTNVLVCTEGNPYIASGITSTGMSLDKIELDQACVSKRSITPVGSYGVIYASPDGLVMVSSGGAEILTEGVITREQWQSTYFPATIKGVAHEGRYYGFYNTGAARKAFVFDLRDKSLGLIDLELAVTAAYQDMLTDEIYLMIGSNIVRFNDAAGKMTYTWRSKTFRPEKPANFACAQVFASAYSAVTFKYYVDGVLSLTQSVASNAPFRLPAKWGREFYIEMTGTDTVTEVVVAESMQELRQV